MSPMLETFSLTLLMFIQKGAELWEISAKYGEGAEQQ